MTKRKKTAPMTFKQKARAILAKLNPKRQSLFTAVSSIRFRLTSMREAKEKPDAVA